MRPVYVFACMAIGLVSPCLAAEMDIAPSHHTPISDVTVVLDIKGSFSPDALRQMEREANDIIGSSGIRLDWRMRNEAAKATFNDLVVLTFNGTCAFRTDPPVYDELAPFAFTRTESGVVQPFGDVNCDHVVGSARAAMNRDDFARGDLLVGRALGRVVAHELVHMLTHSSHHASEGVQKPALSGKQLISSSLNLSELDIDRLKQEHVRLAKSASPDTDMPAVSGTR